DEAIVHELGTCSPMTLSAAFQVDTHTGLVLEEARHRFWPGGRERNRAATRAGADELRLRLSRTSKRAAVILRRLTFRAWALAVAEVRKAAAELAYASGVPLVRRVQHVAAVERLVSAAEAHRRQFSGVLCLGQWHRQCCSRDPGEALPLRRVRGATLRRSAGRDALLASKVFGLWRAAAGSGEGGLDSLEARIAAACCIKVAWARLPALCIKAWRAEAIQTQAHRYCRSQIRNRVEGELQVFAQRDRPPCLRLDEVQGLAHEMSKRGFSDLSFAEGGEPFLEKCPGRAVTESVCLQFHVCWQRWKRLHMAHRHQRDTVAFYAWRGLARRAMAVEALQSRDGVVACLAAWALHRQRAHAARSGALEHHVELLTSRRAQDLCGSVLRLWWSVAVLRGCGDAKRYQHGLGKLLRWQVAAAHHMSDDWNVLPMVSYLCTSREFCLMEHTVFMMVSSFWHWRHGVARLRESYKSSEKLDRRSLLLHSIADIWASDQDSFWARSSFSRWTEQVRATREHGLQQRRKKEVRRAFDACTAVDRLKNAGQEAWQLEALFLQWHRLAAEPRRQGQVNALQELTEHLDASRLAVAEPWLLVVVGFVVVVIVCCSSLFVVPSFFLLLFVLLYL
ncbi:unnamed protein product, partial [Polarella glacialis]